jgi:GDP-4-dehydro-6-deoxy-D-mannose reductase
VSGLPLVTGATGFAGSHLVEDLLRTTPAVAAWSNPRGAAVVDHDPRVHWQAVSLLDRRAVFSAIDALKPSVVYHCAGAADVGTSWDDPVKPLQVNALGTHYLLDAVKEASLGCPVLVPGSALVYRPSLEAISEESPIGPSSPYGFSKLAQEMIGAQSSWCPVFLARPFNHAGPRQSTAYVTSSFARQIAGIEAGLVPAVVNVGNLDARRDITDVRDTVRGYRLLVEKGKSGRPYNVCSGRAYRIGDLLELLLKLSSTSIRIAVDPSRMRPSDNPVVAGNPARMANDVGWHASIPIEQTLEDLLDYWRLKVAVPRA